jgi:hypothetical protein
MKTLTLKELRTNGAKAISDNEVSLLIVNSVPKSALLPIDIYEDFLSSVEELIDIKTTIERMKEENIPAEKVFKNLLNK